MKKYIAIFIFIIGFFGISCAYMEDKVFCTITKNAITVTMEKQGNYKCSEYISVLSQTINKEYNNILSLQKLINQGYDVDYRKEIREQKRAQLKKMLNIKEQIEDAVSDFDRNLFVKIKEYLVYSTSSVRTKYKKAANFLENYQKNGGYLTTDVKKKLGYLKESVTVIDNINFATGYDVLMKNYNRYLYLKNQIEGK